MRRIVMKFGGTSVADLPRISAVSSIIVDELNNFPQIIVVVSAMAGQTNELGKKVEEINSLYDAREYSAIVSAGENITAGLVALQLQEMGKQ